MELAEILVNIIGEDDRNENSNSVKVSIQPDEALNALVVRADPSTMLEIKGIVASLDIRRMQVLIEAAIVEVNEEFTGNWERNCLSPTPAAVMCRWV